MTTHSAPPWFEYVGLMFALTVEYGRLPVWYWEGVRRGTIVPATIR